MQGAMIVTPLYAALLALWFVLLSLRVISLRRSARESLGDGGDAALTRAIRGQANFAEYVPLALLLLAMLELSRFSIYLVHVLGLLLLIARLVHGYAFAYAADPKTGRYWGALLTFVVIGIESVLCLYQSYRGHIVWFA
jgi:uncharacterized protein